jgi:beta-phosphoglucomutase-like phosphatase (HAD superfamily)
LTAIILSLDGVLIDDSGVKTRAWAEVFREFFVTVQESEIHAHAGLSARCVARALGRARGHFFNSSMLDLLERRHDLLVRSRASQRLALPGAQALLQALRRSKVPFGIVTAERRPQVPSSIDALLADGDAPFVDGGSAPGSGHVRDLFIECRRRLRMPTSRCVVVGASKCDMRAASSARLKAVGLLTSGFSEREMLEAGAMRVHADLNSLMRSLP